METIPLCVSVKSKIPESNTGLNSEAVARNLTPFCSDIVNTQREFLAA